MKQTGRYVLIAGKFQIRHAGSGAQPRPDGDTVKFVVDDRAVVEALPRFDRAAPRISAGNAVNLRLEVIDALETHFPTSGGPETHQPPALAYAARDALLADLGFRDLVFDAHGVATAARAFEVAGHVLANGIEGNGRVVAFAFAGKAKKASGTKVWLDAALAARSANWALLDAGLAYATLYETLPHELILAARKSAQAARKRGVGVYGEEEVGVARSAAIKDLAQLQSLVMLPKLFRRLAQYFVETEGKLADFDAWVRAEAQRDDRLLLPSGEIGNLHDLYRIANKRLGLRHAPEDVVVLQ
jgi:hypothetical protein